MTSQSLKEKLEGIVLSDLPQTYIDAIAITRKLNFRYIWHDSLGIIQGWESDWEQESAVMDKVYSHSYFTIAAAASRDGNSGCFKERECRGGIVLELKDDSVFQSDLASTDVLSKIQAAKEYTQRRVSIFPILREWTVEVAASLLHKCG